MQSSLFSNAENESPDAFSLQNSKLLKVRLDRATVQAKRGSMVAYQGDVRFQAAGSGGLGKFLKKAVTGEGQDLMLVDGSGEVFLADLASDIHLVKLEGDALSCNGQHVLAFESGIEHDIERVKGAGIAAGGLFNMTLKGSGWVALTSEGTPVVLDTSTPTFVDPQAAICWSANLRPSFNTDMSGGLKNLVRGGSGESFQMALHGQGWVIVQPSEGLIPTIAAQVGTTSSGGGGIGSLLNG